MKRLALAMAVATLSVQAVAETSSIERPYVGIDYQVGTFELSSGETAEPTAVRLRAGTELMPMLAVEAHAAAPAASDTLALPGVNYDVELNGLYAVFLRPQFKLGDVASVYGLLGYGYADLRATSDNPSFSSVSGFQKGGSFGAGVDFTVYKNIGFNADYVEYIDGYKAVSAGIRFSL